MRALAPGGLGHRGRGLCEASLELTLSDAKDRFGSACAFIRADLASGLLQGEGMQRLLSSSSKTRTRSSPIAPSHSISERAVRESARLDHNRQYCLVLHFGCCPKDT